MTVSQTLAGLRPGTLLVGSFAGVILLGTGLLLLPGVSTGAGLSLLEAFFTATSATCVTGLIVVDTATDLTWFGQSLVLLLIQVGGLGILTFSTLALSLLGNRGGIRIRQLFQDLLTLAPGLTLGRLVGRIVLLTLCTEAVGALVLGILFARSGIPPARAAALGLFHSVSALCNAGFSLFSDSLSSYRAAHGITLTIAALIILGGLGFIVLLEVPRWCVSRSPRPHLSLHTRLVLAMTALLLVAGTLSVRFLEREATLTGLTTQEGWSAAFFHSVNARTAGFNSLPVGEMTDAELFVTMMLMFVGGGPGSIAGGVKITTLAVFAFLCYAWLRGRREVRIGRRTVPETVAYRAVATIGICGVTVLVGLLLLFVFEHERGTAAASGILPMHLAFEAFSAFGTVGLSTGITPDLSPGSQCVVAFLMFTGRVGPLTLAFTLLGNDDAPSIGFPEESIMIG